MKYPKITYKKNNNWELTDSFELDSYVIPKGFRTDLASVPKLFWSILPPIGQWMTASIIHDYLYQEKTLTRKQADKELYKYMIYYNVKIPIALLIYISVRLFGKKYFNN